MPQTLAPTSYPLPTLHTLRIAIPVSVRTFDPETARPLFIYPFAIIRKERNRAFYFFLFQSTRNARRKTREAFREVVDATRNVFEWELSPLGLLSRARRNLVLGSIRVRFVCLYLPIYDASRPTTGRNEWNEWNDRRGGWSGGMIGDR